MDKFKDLIELIIGLVIWYYIFKFFKKKKKKKVIIEEKKDTPIDFMFDLENVVTAEAKKLYNNEDSSSVVTFQPYNNGENYKAITDENNEVLGDVPLDCIETIKNYQVRTGSCFITKKLNNEGKMDYNVQIYARYYKKAD